MSALTYRRAQRQDFESMVKLQNENLATRLPEDEKQQGFLSGSFSQEQFSELNNDLAVIVCVDESSKPESSVVGFLCASSVAFNQPYKLPATMTARFSNVTYKDRLLSDYSAVVAGPVCVDRNYRGQGVFESMYDCLLQNVPKEYDLISVLVSTNNPRSIRAHEKVGLETIDTFDFEGRSFVTMVRPV